MVLQKSFQTDTFLFVTTGHFLPMGCRFIVLGS